MSSPENLHEASIPLLTEVIPPQAAAGVSTRPAAPAATAATPPASAPIAHTSGTSNTPSAAPAASLFPTQALAQAPVQPVQPVQPVLHLSEHDWEQLQNKLSERVLRQLQGRIDFVLEQRIRDSLADVLQLAMSGLTSEIKRGLQHTLEEVIGRAVAQEIARLQNQKK